MASAWLLLAFSLAAAQSFDQLTPGVLEPALELPQLPKTNSTLNLTCFGWRLLAPELILTSGGALHFGERITEEELLSIRHVSADLIVTDDWFLTNLDLLAGLESVGGNVEIRWNERLRDISGLSNIRVIGGTMNIMFNPSLSDMPGFTQLEVVGRSLKILHNTALVSITGFPALARIGRDFTLIGNEKLLSAPRMPSLRAVDGSIEVVYNRALHSLDDMVVALERVEGNFIIKDNDNLTKITVLPTIQSIGQLTISFNNAITEVHGLPYLEQMGSLTISGNKMLEKIEGFPTLQLLKGQFRVSHNKQLQSLSFGNLTTIEGNLDLLDNDNLTTAEFLSLHTVSGNVQVGYNRQLVRFSSSMVFAQKIEFLANYELREVLLPNLSIVTGDSKAAVSGDLRISFNFQLEEVAGFEKLKQVSGDLEILANSKLRDVSAFSRLALIGGSLIVKNNTVLEDMSGFSSDLTVQNLQIQDNQQLKGISGLSTLPTVRGYAVLGINCTGNYVLRPQAVVCSACKPWEVPSLDKTTCQLDYYFIFVVGLACVLSFCLAFALFMTVRTVMVVDNIIITAAGRVVLRTTERHYLLRGFWGRSFPLKLEGTGCQFLECQPIVRARAVSDTELELLVKMERCRSPRRTMSSLPMSEMVESPKNAQISMNFKGLDSSPAGMEPPAAGSCLLSCQGFAHVRSPWELLAAGLSLPTLVWACMFLIAIAALVYLGMSSGIRPEATLVPALQSFGIGAACALLLRLLAVLRRQGQRRLRARQLREVQLLAELEKACWEGSSERILKLQKELAARGWSHQRFSSTLQGVRKRQSEEAGVSVAFLLSEEFLDLAQGRSRMENPNFYDLKDAFFLREEPIGRDLLCPRDGMPGCALVDVVDQRHRRQCTHFLSWAWSYSVTLVRSALRSWMDQSKLVPGTTFLYMCFFVNNQYRILLDHQGAGSRDWSLGEVFEENLQRIGRMVALLDHWDQPAYLSRIWTIFEQYSAVVLEIEVTFILPQTSGDSLLQEIRKGEEGILQVRESLCNVDAETAGAWCAEDEKMVKRLIEQTIGFEKVNEKVQELMIAWVATMVKDYLGNLVVMGTRRLQRLKAQSFLSANATEWTHKMSTRTDASATLQTVKMKSHNSPIWTRYLNEDTQVSVFKSPSRR